MAREDGRAKGCLSYYRGPGEFTESAWRSVFFRVFEVATKKGMAWLHTLAAFGGTGILYFVALAKQSMFSRYTTVDEHGQYFQW